jgi:hypothetical protein
MENFFIGLTKSTEKLKGICIMSALPSRVSSENVDEIHISFYSRILHEYCACVTLHS